MQYSQFTFFWRNKYSWPGHLFLNAILRYVGLSSRLHRLQIFTRHNSQENETFPNNSLDSHFLIISRHNLVTLFISFSSNLLKLVLWLDRKTLSPLPFANHDFSDLDFCVLFNEYQDLEARSRIHSSFNKRLCSNIEILFSGAISGLWTLDHLSYNHYTLWGFSFITKYTQISGSTENVSHAFWVLQCCHIRIPRNRKFEKYISRSDW